MSLRPIGVRRPGVPSQQENYYSLKIRSIELGGGNPEELESLRIAFRHAQMRRIRNELPNWFEGLFTPAIHNWKEEGF